jgi:hypothetical protein
MSANKGNEPVWLCNKLVAVIRPRDAEPAAISVADEVPTSTATLSIVDSAGRMLVDQNGNLIISFAGRNQ